MRAAALQLFLGFVVPARRAARTHYQFPTMRSLRFLEPSPFTPPHPLAFFIRRLGGAARLFSSGRTITEKPRRDWEGSGESVEPRERRGAPPTRRGMRGERKNDVEDSTGARECAPSARWGAFDMPLPREGDRGNAKDRKENATVTQCGGAMVGSSGVAVRAVKVEGLRGMVPGTRKKRLEKRESGAVRRQRMGVGDDAGSTKYRKGGGLDHRDGDTAKTI
ncbi:hypothetical protein C8J57DRAFT_1482111 [Mycena rebaudengoi]|nr:hypothetical protein C8J57DRAFT_1482111 [Mycena rebaudengoi]